MGWQRDPITDQEWQDAVNAAHVLLLLDSARLYGFVTGGPEVDVDRCEQLLEAAAARGIHPAPEVVECWVAGGDPVS